MAYIHVICVGLVMVVVPEMYIVDDKSEDGRVGYLLRVCILLNMIALHYGQDQNVIKGLGSFTTSNNINAKFNISSKFCHFRW